MSRTRWLMRRRLYMTGLSAIAVLSGCEVTDPAEAFLVKLSVFDPYNVPGVLELAKPSQPVNVSVLVGNYGAEAVTYDVPCPRFRVTDEHGVDVGPPPSSCSGPTRIVLFPGESMTFTSQWAGEDFNGSQLPIGAYGIEGSARRVGRDYSNTTGIAWVCLVPESHGRPTRDPCPRPSPGDSVNAVLDRSGRTLRSLGGRPQDPWLEVH